MVTRISLETGTTAPTGSTNAYLIEAGEGLVIDPAAQSPRLDTVIQERDISHLALTHHHPDHVGAVSHYATEYDLTVWARYGRTTEFANATGIEPDRQFVVGEPLPVGGDLQVVDTPGHAPEHVSFAVEQSGSTILITGDLALASGSVVVGAPEGDMRAYLSSLRRIRAMKPMRLYPGHGPVIDEPQKVCDRLIAHRLAREAKIKIAVAAGHRTVDALVDDVYEKDISGVEYLAKATVRAHLEKLAVEGHVVWDGQHARVHGD